MAELAEQTQVEVEAVANTTVLMLQALAALELLL
jgi:hypothetical protein